MMEYSKECGDRREVFDRAMGRCQCTRFGRCHRPDPPWLAGRCERRFEFRQDGWTIGHRIPREDGGTHEKGNKLLLCEPCAENRRGGSTDDD